MLWLALHLPALSLEAWAGALPPDQASRPLALLHEHQVLLADARARGQGVRPGMKRATALALSPDLLLGAADARRDALALRAVAHVALGFSPAVAWATPPDWRPAPDEAVAEGTPPAPAPSAALVGVRLEVQSCQRYFGGLPALVAQLRGRLQPLGHRVRIAAAPTALGAALLAAGPWAAAPAAPPSAGRAGRRVAEVARRGGTGAAPAASPGQAPGAPPSDPLTRGPHTTDLAALSPLLDALPLHLLGPGRAHWDALQGMGLAVLGDLHGLPRSGLARRFGPGLLDDIDRAHGRLPEAHTWLVLPRRFDERTELLARADTVDRVQHVADQLLARLAAWAQARQGRVARCTLVMHHEPAGSTAVQRLQAWAGDAHAGRGERSTLDIAPAQPAADAAHLRSLLAERLARFALPAPVAELGLHCDALVALPAPNAELFASAGSRREGLSRLVERLQARLGPGGVLRLQPVADHRPECGTRWQPADAAVQATAPAAADSPRAAADAMAQARSAAVLPNQPLWLLPAPEPLPERDDDHQPLLHGRPLQLLAGPQRLETGWWDGDPALRDYFVARDADGALLWLYRDRQPDGDGAAGWFLQGLFA